MVVISGEGLVEVVTTVFVLSTMFSIGVQLSPSQLVNALRKQRLLVNSLLVNRFVVPAVVYLLVRMVPIETGFCEERKKHEEGCERKIELQSHAAWRKDTGRDGE